MGRVRARIAADPADLGVVEASAALRDGRLSSRELVAACLRRVGERNGGPPTFAGQPDAVNAFARVYEAVADGEAAAADERRAREGRRAPGLCGVPVALKDLFAVAGRPL